MKLRDYQLEAVQSVFRYFQSHKEGNAVVAMPTGVGKSLVIAGLIQDILHKWSNQKIMVLSHVRELLVQDAEKLLTMWPTAPAGIYSAGLKSRDVHRNVIFGGIGSVAKNPQQFGHVDLVFVDECHLIGTNESSMYQKTIAALKKRNPYLRVVGFTATQYRMGQGLITDGGLFTDICCDMTTVEYFNWFLSEGYLSPLIPKQTKTYLDTDGVKISKGDFDQKELQTAVDKTEITRAALEEVIEQGRNRNRWLIFTTGIEHTRHTAEMLQDMGVECGYVHSSTKQYPFSDKQRDQVLKDSKSGKLKAIVNSSILTTGYDDPMIDLIVILNPTQSTGKWIQTLGRGTRPVYAPGYDLDTTQGRLDAIANGPKANACLVLDFAANTKRLGPINDPVIPRKKGNKGGTAPIKTCESCGTYNHASARFCINCNREFVFQVKIETKASTVELIKTELPIIEEFKVDHMSYSLHTKIGRPDSVKATYYCGLRKFDEYVCPEHDGFAKKKAMDWWKARSQKPFPDNTEKLLSVVNTVKHATHIRVWTNKKYPEIVNYCFDGSEFGKVEGDPFDTPDIKVFHPNLEIDESDIPF